MCDLFPLCGGHDTTFLWANIAKPTAVLTTSWSSCTCWGWHPQSSGCQIPSQCSTQKGGIDKLPCYIVFSIDRQNRLINPCQMAIRIIDPKKDANKIIDTFIEKKHIYIYCIIRSVNKGEAPPQWDHLKQSPYPILIPWWHLSPIWIWLTKAPTQTKMQLQRVLQVHIRGDLVLSMLNTVAISRRCFSLGVLTVRVRVRCSVDVVSGASGIFPVNFCIKRLLWHVHVHKTALVTCPCAFRLDRLAQNRCRGPGVRHFSCQFLHEVALVTCPCAFRLRRLPQNGCCGRHLAQGSCKRPLTEVLPTELL